MTANRFFCLCASAFAAGCSGGGEGTFRRFIPGPPLEIVSYSPIDSATDVEFDEVVSVTFDSPINPGTVNATTFTVSLDDIPLDGSFDVDQAVVTFVLASPLPPRADLGVTISTGLSSVGGSVLPSAEQWSFTTRDFVWGAPVLVETSSSFAAVPRVSANESGEAIVVWQQGEAPTTIFSSRFAAATGWGVPQQIESAPSEDGAYPQVGIDDSGQAVAAYRRFNGAISNLFGTRTSGTGWTVASPLESGSLNASSMTLAVSLNGAAAVAWEQSDGTRNNVWVNRMDPVSGWLGPESPETSTQSASVPAVAIDAGGTITVAWAEAAAGSGELWANRYSPGSGWGTPTKLENDTTRSVGFPKVASATGGEAVVVWAFETGGNYDLWAVRYVPGVGWSAAEPLEGSGGNVGGYSVAMNEDEAVAVFEQREGGTYFIWSTHLVDGTWSAPVKLNSGSTGALEPVVAIDAEANVVCGWYERNESLIHNIWAARRLSGNTGWEAAERLENDDTGEASFPSVAIGDNGRSIVVWQQQDGTRENIWSAWLQ